MAKTHSVSSLTLEPRDGTGTTSAKALRRAGKIPGVVYGHGTSTPVTIEAKQLTDVLLSGNRSGVLDATVAGTRDSVLLRRIETDPLTRKPLSVDFQRVGRDEEVSATVTLVTTGTPRGVREQGGILDVVIHALDLKGPARAIPPQLVVDVEGLSVHEHVVAAQVPLPQGFTLLTPADTVVVACETNRATAAAGPEELEPTEAPATPPAE